MLEDQGPRLALIVGAARSGTTLARLLLDSHPEIGCPAEAGLPGLMSHMGRVWFTIDADILDAGVATDPGQTAAENMEGQLGEADPPPNREATGEGISGPRLPGPALDWIRATSRVAMERYCARERKTLYVDKSLDSVYHLDLVRELFPDVRCVLAFRHVMDTIASGIEASPWGFQAYGYGPYVQTTPGNTVAALARYWLDHVTMALAWEQEHPELCIRLRYEDLVSNPDEVIAGVQRFLGVREDLGVLRDAFDREPRGPGDYKIEHTSAVHANSIGHGKRVPVAMLPPQLMESINEKLEALGYPPLDRSWNTAERSVNRDDDTIWTERLRTLMSHARSPARDAPIGVFALVAEDHHTLRWIVDSDAGTVTQGDGDVDAVLTGTTEDLVLMLTDQENLGSLLRAGRIRHLVADEAEATSAKSFLMVKAIAEAMQECVRQYADR
jgi:hypothetical protein